jgi:hypothetical protein
MSVWNVAKIEDQPSVSLWNWTIKHTDKGDYFVGTEGVGSGRVSTRIVEFDPDKRVGRTASGRIYQLLGDEGEGYSSNGEYVWGHYKQVNNLTELQKEEEEEEVSGEHE